MNIYSVNKSMMYIYRSNDMPKNKEKCKQMREDMRDRILKESSVYFAKNAFKDVPHIEYHGKATGSPWGAISVN